MHQLPPRLTQLLRLTALGVLATVAGIFSIETLGAVSSPAAGAAGSKVIQENSTRVARRQEPSRNLISLVRDGKDEESHENTFLDDATCVTRGKEVSRTSHEVVVDKKLYTSIIGILPGSKVICRLRKTGSRPQFKTLSLIFGLDDDSALTGTRIVIYKDDEKAESQIVSKGELNKLFVNVEDAHSITLEIKCPPDTSECQLPEEIDDSEQFKYSVNFFQATLDPIRRRRR